MAKAKKEKKFNEKTFVATMMARIRTISVGLSGSDEQEEEMRNALLKAAEEAGAKLTKSGKSISNKMEFTPTLMERIAAAVPTPSKYVEEEENGKVIRTRDQMYEDAFNKFREHYEDFMEGKIKENIHDTRMTDAWTDLGKKYKENPHRLLSEEIRKTIKYMNEYVDPSSVDLKSKLDPTSSF